MLNPIPQVLIVDESAESREVLQVLLERRGATTIAVPRPEQAVALTAVHRPNLIILDADSDRSPTGAATDDLRATAYRNGTPIVILGTFRRTDTPEPQGQFISKPYHYGPLIHKIESMLAAA